MREVRELQSSRTDSKPRGRDRRAQVRAKFQ